MVSCEKCGKEVKERGLKYHMWRLHSEEGLSHNPNKGFEDGTRNAWNKGSTKADNAIVAKYAASLSKSYNDGKFELKGCCSSDYFGSEQHKKSAAKGGGYRPKSGCGKGQYYNDSYGNKVYLQSSYEVLCAEILDKMNIRWIRPTYLHYNLDGKTKKYFADFYLVDYDVYLDTKNDYLIVQDAGKINAVITQNKVKLFVLDQKQISEVHITNIVV
jgi:hypothetical protein